MKKVFLLLLALLTLHLQAAPVDEATAQKTASSFFAKKGKQVTKVKRVKKAPRKGETSTNVQETAYYYVFNADNDGGFVIVSGDDSTVPVLGYSDKGHFDSEKIPDNMKAWLQGYADQIEAMTARQSFTTETVNVPVMEPARKAIAPLLTAQWNQDAPYNNDCPDFFGYGNSVTGCVATAMAQVLYYHRETSKAQGITRLQANISQYNTKSYGISVGPFYADSSPIDWDNMLDKYSGSETEVQKRAVSLLMVYCGASVSMDYALSDYGGSSASLANIPAALKTYFGYDAGTVLKNRADYTVAGWKELIYNEILNGRPVAYGGQSSGSGHAFVIDGYDGEDMFHFNWGWGGDSNGYFLLQVANPRNTSGIGSTSTQDGYSMDQDAIIGAQPNTGTSPAEEPKVLTAELQSLSGATAIYNFINNTNTSMTVECGLGIADAEGNVSLIKKWAHSASTLSGGGAFFGGISLPLTVSNFSGMATGSYRLVPVFRESSDAVWRVCNHDKEEYLIVDYNGTTISVSAVQPILDLSVTTLSFPGTPTATNTVQVDALVKNTGSEYNGRLYLFASPTTDKGSAVTKTGFAVEAGKEAPISFWFTPTTAGTYTLWITTDEAGTNIIGTTSVEISASSVQTLSAEDLTLENGTATSTYGGTVYGSHLKGTLRLKNNGTETFRSGITIQLYSYRQYNGDWGYWSADDQTFMLTIAAGGTETLSFDFSHQEQTNYLIVINYATGGNIVQYPIYNSFTLQPGIELTKADGSARAVAATGSVTIPEDVVAVDIAGVASTISSITPNSNPNTLYYIGTDETPPADLDNCNVVKGCVAETITLKAGYDFLVPNSFTAEYISYELIPTIGSTGSGGWQTVALPYNVTSVTADGTPVDWFHSSTDTDKNFWVRQFVGLENENTILFGNVDRMEAYQPYIVAFPSNKWGEVYNLVGKTIKFIGHNALIRNDAMMRISTSGANFEGTTVGTPVSNCYTLDTAGKTFNRGDAMVKPFQGYFVKKALDEMSSRLNIAFIDDQDVATSIDNSQFTIDNSQWNVDSPVYNLRGQRVGKDYKGIVIVNGKKVFVK